MFGSFSFDRYDVDFNPDLLPTNINPLVKQFNEDIGALSVMHGGELAQVTRFGLGRIFSDETLCKEFRLLDTAVFCSSVLYVHVAASSWDEHAREKSPYRNFSTIRIMR